MFKCPMWQVNYDAVRLYLQAWLWLVVLSSDSLTVFLPSYSPTVELHLHRDRFMYTAFCLGWKTCDVFRLKLSQRALLLFDWARLARFEAPRRAYIIIQYV